MFPPPLVPGLDLSEWAVEVPPTPEGELQGWGEVKEMNVSALTQEMHWDVEWRS